MTAVKCFVAYPSNPPIIAETIEGFIKNINETGSDVVEIIGWKSYPVGGKPVVHEICREINKSTVFICDLTNLNSNVLFELGYAIANNKYIWITIDSSYGKAITNYKKLSLLSTIGYTDYINRYELTNKFLKEEPYNNNGDTLLEKIINNLVYTTNKPPYIFYLKSEVNTDASIILSRCLKASSIPLVTDDPEEVPIQSLDWYLENIYYSYAIVTHFIDDERAESSSALQNYKYAFISGLAYGFNKPLLMLAHSPFNPPFDYNDLLRVHDTASMCEHFANTWLYDVRKGYQEQIDLYKGKFINIKQAVGLQKINLGEYVAENEETELSNYFVETASYNNALNPSQYLIYVGRKGSGKTANLYQISETLSSDKRNHTCILKPIDYELEGVIRLLSSSLAKADPGYLTESLWKFLVYTELAFSVYETLISKPDHYMFDEVERNFLDYVRMNKDIIVSDFTVRMEKAINDLCEIGNYQTINEQRAKVSEILHSRLLGDLRDQLGLLLEKKKKVVVLVDNLDKMWIKSVDLHLLSDFVFGLLSCGQSIVNDYQKISPKRKQINLSLIIFLRSDIFAHIMQDVREPDKVVFTRMDWNDPKLLIRVIEERFANSLNSDIPNPEEIWANYFVPYIKGIPTKEYIVNRVIPRPRDIIYFCKNALSQAINHKNIQITEEDILKAEKVYSEYVFNSLLAETDVQLPGIEDLLYEFAGASQIVTHEQIQTIFSKSNTNERSLDEFIDLLCDSTFLGLEVQKNKFEYLYEPNKKKVIQKIAKGVAEKNGGMRYKINPPFHTFLEIIE